MNLKRLLFGFGLALALAGQALHAQQSDGDGKQLTELRAKAEQGNAQAQNELGEAFRLGKLGLTTNVVEAVKWYRKAAEQNYAEAQYSLGFCYATGEGVAKDEVEAYKWMRLAAAQDSKGAKTVITKLEGKLSQEQIAEGKRRANDWLEQRKKSSAGRQ